MPTAEVSITSTLESQHMPVPVQAHVEGSVTVVAAAAELNTTTKFIRSRIADGTINAFRIAGSRLIRIPTTELEALKRPIGDNTDGIDAEIERLVDLAPKLTPAQRHTIASLFATVQDGGGVNGAHNEVGPRGTTPRGPCVSG